jgi:hypothetical protein
MVSATVAFPDFSSSRERDVQHAFVCTLQAGDVGCRLMLIAGPSQVDRVLALSGRPVAGPEGCR